MVCENCGCEDADYVIDPYQQDVCGIEVYVWICNKCYSDLIQEI